LSAVPSCFPAQENGWHGQDPDQTDRVSGQPAERSAWLQTAIPQNM
jgi:hypothetical protein